LIPLAVKIIQGEKPASFCEIAEDYKMALLLNPILEAISIQGHVIHIDSYGNLISNISKSDFDRFGENVPFTIYYHNKSYHLDKISPTYNSVVLGDKVAIFNNAGLLEIAINQGANRTYGGADKLFGVRKGDIIRVIFEPAGSHKSINTLQF
jgi:S-adenosylmethionine hydrolase